jgi:hypothetical protein
LRLKELLAEGKVDGREALVVDEEGLDLVVVGSKVANQDRDNGRMSGARRREVGVAAKEERIVGMGRRRGAMTEEPGLVIIIIIIIIII